jgi:hypothetical protein
LDPHHNNPDDTEPPAIQNRHDVGGAWSTAWPLLALALIGLMLVRTCLPSSPVAPPSPPAAIKSPAQ